MLDSDVYSGKLAPIPDLLSEIAMKKVKISLTVEQANLVEDVISNRMVRIYDGATEWSAEERAELEKNYKALEAVWKSLIIATAKVSA